jgi:hypothetical protein
MILYGLYAFQQLMLRTYVRNLMAFATLAYVVAQEIRRKRTSRVRALPASSRLQSEDVVSIASRSFGPTRGRDVQAQAAVLLSYRAFADRVKRSMARRVAAQTDRRERGE